MGGVCGLLVLLVCCCVGLYACKKCCFSKNNQITKISPHPNSKSLQPTAPPLSKTGHWDQQQPRTLPPFNPHFQSCATGPEAPPAYIDHTQPTNQKHTHRQNSDTKRISSVHPIPPLPGSIETDYDTNTNTNVSAQNGGVSLSNKTHAKHSISLAGVSKSGGIEYNRENKNETSVTTESGIKIATQTSNSSSFRITS